jgi:hypothetical protein
VAALLPGFRLKRFEKCFHRAPAILHAFEHIIRQIWDGVRQDCFDAPAPPLPRVVVAIPGDRQQVDHSGIDRQKGCSEVRVAFC